MKALNTDYKQWLAELKGKIRSTQIKAAIAVNSALIQFYWELGKMIAEKENVWGDKLIEQVAKDLQSEFPDIKGLSKSNLKYCKRFYEFYANVIGKQLVDQLQHDESKAIVFRQQLVAQIPWGHSKIIITKIKDKNETEFKDLML